MYLLDWITKLDNQTIMVIPETLFDYINKNFDREIADKIIVILVRSALSGETFDGYDLYNDTERAVLDLLFEKVGVFGRSVHEGGDTDGEE